MSSYCLKCEKNTENIEFRRVSKTKKILLSKCAICGSKSKDLLKNKKQVEY